MRRSSRDPPAFSEQGTSLRTGTSSEVSSSHATPMQQRRFSNLITPPRQPTATVILPSASSYECDQRRVRFPEGHTITLRYDANAPVSSRPSSQQGSHPPSTRSNLALDFVLNLEEGQFSDTTAEAEVSSSDNDFDSEEDTPSSLHTDITNVTTEAQRDGFSEHHHRRRPTSLPVPSRRHSSQDEIRHTCNSHARWRDIAAHRLPYAPRHSEPGKDDMKGRTSSHAPPVGARFRHQAFSDILSEDEDFHIAGRVASPSSSQESSASDEPIFAMDEIYECTERSNATRRSEEPKIFGRLENTGRSYRTSGPKAPERHQPSLQAIPGREAFIPSHRRSASLAANEFSTVALSGSAASQRPTRPSYGLSTNHGQGSSTRAAPKRSNLTSSLAQLSSRPGMTSALISRPTQTAELGSVTSTSGRRPTSRQRHSAPPAPRASHDPRQSVDTSGPRRATRASFSVSTAASGRNLIYNPTAYSSQQSFSPEAVFQYSTSNDRILKHHSQTLFEYQPYTSPSSSSATRSSHRIVDTAPPAYTPRHEQVQEESFEERSSQPLRPQERSSTVDYTPDLATPAISPPSITPRRRPLSEQLSAQISMMRTRPNARNRNGLSWDTSAAMGFLPQVPWQRSGPQVTVSSRYPPQQQAAMPTVPSLVTVRRMTAPPPRPTRPPFDPTLAPFTPTRETNTRSQSASRPWLVSSNATASFSPTSSSSIHHERLPESILAAFPQTPSAIPPPQLLCAMPSGSAMMSSNRNGVARASLPESPTVGAASGSRSVMMQIATEDQLQDRATETSSNASQSSQASRQANRLSLKTPFKNMFNGNFFKTKDKDTDKGKGRKE
ncbi:unnamed protein product [Mortierella alpina]